MIRRILICAVLALLAVALPSAKKGDLEFEVRSYDFGTVTDTHDPIVREYDFVNTSSQPVAVLSVTTGCGCTKPEYPLKPVGPGEKGKIVITFLPKGQRGNINRDINVRYRGAKARSSARVTLKLKGTVVPGE